MEVKTWCPTCGPRVTVDKDGWCIECQSLAVGKEVDEIDRAFTDKDNYIAFLESVIKKFYNEVTSKDRAIVRMNNARILVHNCIHDAKKIFNQVIQ